MRRNGYGGWFEASCDAWMLGAEASAVVALRMAAIAAGGSKGAAEIGLMVSEKIQAALELNVKAVTGGLGTSPLAGTRGTLGHYRRKVAANRRRLTR